MTTFLIFLSWEIFLMLISFFMLPLAVKALNNKSIFVWTFAKVGGLLFISYTVWLLQNLNFLFIQSVAATFLIFIGLNIYLLVKNSKELKLFFKSKIVKIIGYELVFTTSSLVYLIYRGINPRVEGIEKFMDQAILNSLIKTNSIPPTDVWYSQSHLQYYYFGQYILALISRLLKTPFELNYNIAISYSFALAFTTCVAVLILITKNKYVSFLGSIAVLLAGNLDYIYKSVFVKKSDYFFAEARSLIEYAITEFPAYSYILGDLHAHLLNIPFVLFYIGLCYFYLKNSKSYYFHVTMGFFLGILFMVNSWDFIIYSLLTGIILAYKVVTQKNIKKFFINISITAGVSLVTLLPFKLNFNAAVSGVGFNNKFSSPQALFLMFGHFLIIFAVFLVLKKIFKIKLKRDELAFTNILFFSGVLLVILAELFFIKDIYFTANPSYFRANTVFKVWYQAFIFFGLASVFYIYDLIKTKKIVPILASTIFVAIFIYNCIYTYNGIKYYVTSTPKEQRGLNGMLFLNTSDLSNEKAAIEYLNKNIKKQVIILEKPGESYTTDNLFSVFTGNPTVVGWINHEFGWQGKWDPIAYTLTDIELIYTSTDENQVKNLIKKNKIEYIIVGSKEKAKYGVNTGETVSKLYKIFYQNNSVKIYRVD